nr:hypothetical protein CparaKRNrm2_p030 [Cryptomonas paramecium]
MFFKVYIAEKIKTKNTIFSHIQLRKNSYANIKKKALFYLWLFAYKCLIVYVKIRIVKHVNKMKKIYLIQKQNFYNKAFVLIFNISVSADNWCKRLCSNFFFYFSSYPRLNKNYLILFQSHLFREKKKCKPTLNFLLEKIEKSSNCFKTLRIKKLKFIKHSLFYKDYEYLNSYIKTKITNINNFLNYKLLEQSSTVEHVYDYFTHTKTAHETINRVKSKRDHFYQHNKIKFVILIYWVCLIIAIIFTSKKARLTLV